jgi:hypothetical protein
LLKARAERKRWIQTIPLPYDPELFLANHTGDGKFKDNATYRLWASRESMDQFQTSLVFSDRLLHGTTSILSELYGIGSSLDDDESDGEDGEEDDSNPPKDLPNRPLSVDDIAARVDRLVSCYTRHSSRFLPAEYLQQ